MNWHVRVEVAGSGPPPEDDALFDLMESLADRHASVTGSAESPVDGLSRYGASMLIEADSAGEAAGTAVADLIIRAKQQKLPEWPVVRIEVMTEAELEAELATPNFPTLIGVSELSRLIGVSRQRASALAKSASFPRPVAELQSGPVWTETSVRHFIEEWERRPGRPRATATG